MIDVRSIRRYTSLNISAGRSGFATEGLPDNKRRESMEKSVVINSGVVVLTVVILCGCQIFSLGPSDEKLINATMAKWKAALIAHDMDKFLETYSENYRNIEGGDKNSVREYGARAINEGYLDNLKVNLKDAKIKIEGDMATVAPIELTSDTGTYVLEYNKLKKENGVWLIISSKAREE